MNVRTIPRWLMPILVVAIVGALVAFGPHVWRHRVAEEYRAFSSPDGSFQIVVFRVPTGFAMPGQGSDSPGYFQLRDKRTGRVLRERDVEMVQLVERVEWSPTNVVVPLLSDWRLPQ